MNNRMILFPTCIYLYIYVSIVVSLPFSILLLFNETFFSLFSNADILKTDLVNMGFAHANDRIASAARVISIKFHIPASLAIFDTGLQ